MWQKGLWYAHITELRYTVLTTIVRSSQLKIVIRKITAMTTLLITHLPVEPLPVPVLLAMLLHLSQRYSHPNEAYLLLLCHILEASKDVV